MSQLSDVEKFFIEGHRDIDPKALAHKLGASIILVRNYIKSLNNKDEKEAQRIKEEEDKIKAAHEQQIKPLTANDLMMKREKRGVVVMTQEASQIGDESRKQNRMSPKLAKNVKKIRPE